MAIYTFHMKEYYFVVPYKRIDYRRVPLIMQKPSTQKKSYVPVYMKENYLAK